MRDHYDFSKMKRVPNPLLSRLKKRPITIRLDTFTIDYFKRMADVIGMPYQNLINLYLRDCTTNRRRLDMKWVA